MFSWTHNLLLSHHLRHVWAQINKNIIVRVTICKLDVTAHCVIKTDDKQETMYIMRNLSVHILRRKITT